MAKTVFYEEKPSSGAVITVFNQDGVISSTPIDSSATIGRNPDKTISINSPIISRNHGEIAVANGEYYYRDLDSTNGTYVNDELIGIPSSVEKKATVLKDGDIICFDIRENGQHRPDRVFALFTTCLEITEQWDKIKLTADIAEICIGRSEDSSLKVQDEMISEKHASFFCSNNGWAIIDHQSTNGVFLNGKRMSSPRYLKTFDVIRIVNTYFIFTGDYLLFSNGIKNTPAESEKMPVVRDQKPEPIPERKPIAVSDEKQNLIINITERSVVQRFKKMLLLQDINLSVSNGEMVLILGGSGAGKTTFINAVMGYEKAKGKIVYKDTDIYEEYEQMKYEIGFVPQQDLLRGSDSVYDTLSNAAEMKLPKSVSYEKREERIKSVLEQLGLSREKDTLVSKLSGGQRKRLSIAVEFISNPSLFFLDEPDSGVDDVMGRGLMESLRNIADQGKIVMVITHSPERAADLFDKVIVLAKSTKDNCGHLAFFGSVNEAFSFFEVDSFREIVKKINRPDENGEGLSDFYIDKYMSRIKG